MRSAFILLYAEQLVTHATKSWIQPPHLSIPLNTICRLQGSIINHHKTISSSLPALIKKLSNQLDKKQEEFSFHPVSKMKNLLIEQVIGVPITSAAYRVEKTPRRYLPDATGQYRISSSGEGSTTFKKGKGNFVLKRMNKLGKKADTFAHGVREHVRLGPKITETVKGKLSLGARILQVGGVEKIFRQLFSVTEGEKLFKACQCYLSTTAGPIAGLLFISSEKIAFCSERSIKIPSPNGESLRVRYKVLIPLGKIKEVNQSVNMKKPSEKYMEIVTVDDFDFWFMGFLNYQKALKCLQQVIPQRLHDVEVTF